MPTPRTRTTPSVPTPAVDNESLLFLLANAWTNFENRLTRQLSAVRGVSLGEYRILRTLALAPDSRNSRVELARTVGLTASAVTRALRPLEAMGYVETVRNERDARLALASLTDAGHSLVNDAAGVVRDSLNDMLSRTPTVVAERDRLISMLQELALA